MVNYPCHCGPDAVDSHLAAHRSTTPSAMSDGCGTGADDTCEHSGCFTLRGLEMSATVEKHRAGSDRSTARPVTINGGRGAGGAGR